MTKAARGKCVLKRALSGGCTLAIVFPSDDGEINRLGLSLAEKCRIEVGAASACIVTSNMETTACAEEVLPDSHFRIMRCEPRDIEALLGYLSKRVNFWGKSHFYDQVKVISLDYPYGGSARRMYECGLYSPEHFVWKVLYHCANYRTVTSDAR